MSVTMPFVVLEQSNGQHYTATGNLNSRTLHL